MRKKTGLKDSGLQLLVGVVAGVANEVIASNIAVVQNNWYVAPVGLGLAGAFMNFRGMSSMGAAMCGAAGYSGYLQGRMYYAAKASAATTTETEGLANRAPGRFGGALPPPPQVSDGVRVGAVNTIHETAGVRAR